MSDSPHHTSTFKMSGSITFLCFLQRAAGIRNDSLYRLAFVIRLHLSEHSTHPMKTRSVGVQPKRQREIRVGKNGGTAQLLFQKEERILTRLGPLKGVIFFKEREQWASV